MNDLTALLQRTLDDEPPLGFGVDDLVAGGRRARRRRSAVAGAGSVTALVLVAAALVAGARDAKDSVAPARPASAGSLPAVPDSITKDNRATTVEQQLGVTFRDVTVHERDRMPSGRTSVSLYGAIEDAAGPSAMMLALMRPDAGLAAREKAVHATGVPCDGYSFGNEGDTPPDAAYTGPCATRTLDGGVFVVERTGRTADGYARVIAMLFRPDGSGLATVVTNQDTVDPSTCVETAYSKNCPMAPITRPAPAVTARQLGDLLTALESATR